MKRTEQSKIKYTSYKNVLTKILRMEKKNYYSNQLSLYKHDTQNTWKIIKDAMNLSQNRHSITKIKSNDTTIDDPISMANSFNTYFSTIGENLAQTIPPSNKPFFYFLGSPNLNSLFFLYQHIEMRL